MGYVTGSMDVRGMGRAAGALGRRVREANQAEEQRRAYEEALARARDEQEAAREADLFRLDEIHQQAARVQGETLDATERIRPPGTEGEIGPVQGQLVSPLALGEDPVARRVEHIRQFAGRLPAEHRRRFIEEEGAKLEAEAVQRARHRVIDSIQDRMARGGWNLEGENEPSPMIAGQLEELVAALESGQVDPLQAMEVTDKMADVVQTENQRRYAMARGDRTLDEEISAARSTREAGDLETLKSLWKSGELEIEDLEDRIFEIRTGRKTARAAGPSPYEVRQDALDLWMRTNGTMPTEEDLLRTEALIAPVGSASGSDFGAPPITDPAALVSYEAQGGQDAVSPEARARARTTPTNVPRGTKGKKGGKAASWADMPAEAQAPALQELSRAMAEGEPIADVAKRLQLDLETLPPEVVDALIQGASGGGQEDGAPFWAPGQGMSSIVGAWQEMLGGGPERP